MNRNFPPEVLRSCDHCGTEIICAADPLGGLEANDLRDYVYAPANSDPNDEMYVCARCRVDIGFDD
jgi:hypothetical protein